MHPTVYLSVLTSLSCPSGSTFAFGLRLFCLHVSVALGWLRGAGVSGQLGVVSCAGHAGARRRI
jgi:hypothetical protein